MKSRGSSRVFTSIIRGNVEIPSVFSENVKHGSLEFAISKSVQKNPKIIYNTASIYSGRCPKMKNHNFLDFL